jgi:hypothetical protein
MTASFERRAYRLEEEDFSAPSALPAFSAGKAPSPGRTTMRKLLATGFAILAAATVAVTAAPASAFSIGFGGGYGDWDDHYWPDDGVYIEFDVDDYDYDDSYSSWDAHVEYCEERYQTYDPDTNLYYYAVGEQTECDSPHM